MLYLVPTPIGNLEDITLRALKVLKEVDLVLAEDTRVTKRLFSKFEITTPLQSYHTHNEHKILESIIQKINDGENLALVSDAGTPGISDPGFLIVRRCVEENIPVSCLPGATAMVPALVLSGLPCDRFHFEGFLPQKKGKEKRIKYLLSLPNTFAFYESPYRVIKTLVKIKELSEEERQVAVVREISKVYEEVIRGDIEEVLFQLESKEVIKGEFVIVVSGKLKSK